jgi:hypothetical protein
MGRLVAFPTDFGQGWKGLPGTYTLAYYKNSLITALKSFIKLFLGRQSNGLSSEELPFREEADRRQPPVHHGQVLEDAQPGGPGVDVIKLFFRH